MRTCKYPVYRHYGNDHFKKTLVKNIKQRDFGWGKPFGGFWACRTDADLSWKDYCEMEEFRLDCFDKHFDFTLKDNAKILLIKNISEFVNIKKEHEEWFLKNEYIQFCDLSETFDFVKLSTLFDGIEIYAGSDRELYFKFYGWDCDSIVIFNRDIVEVLKEV